MAADGTLAPPPVRGLRNLGNTCYMNSVLQVLAATRGVREHFLLHDAGSGSGSGSGSGGGGGGGGSGSGGGGGEQDLTENLRSFLWDLHCGGTSADEVLRPVGVLQAVARRHDAYARRAEQDSHELLRQMLDGLHTEMGVALRRRVALENRREGEAAEEEPRTLVDELFSGELRSTIVCLSCGAVSCASEPCLDISLPIPSWKRRQQAQAAEGGAAAGVVSAAADTAASASASAVASAAATAALTAAFEGVSGSAVDVADVLARLPAELTAAHKQIRLGACLQAFASPELV